MAGLCIKEWKLVPCPRLGKVEEKKPCAKAEDAVRFCFFSFFFFFFFSFFFSSKSRGDRGRIGPGRRGEVAGLLRGEALSLVTGVSASGV